MTLHSVPYCVIKAFFSLTMPAIGSSSRCRSPVFSDCNVQCLGRDPWWWGTVGGSSLLYPCSTMWNAGMPCSAVRPLEPWRKSIAKVFVYFSRGTLRSPSGHRRSPVLSHKWEYPRQEGNVQRKMRLFVTGCWLRSSFYG